jgi:L-amino acid N-acyltransferase
MEVRLAERGDAEAVSAIYNVEVTGSTVTFDLVPRTTAEQLAWIEDHQGAHPAVVAVEGGVVAGFGSLSPFHRRPAYATTVEDSVYVDRAWRGRGVGRLLLAELVLLATDHGFHTVLARISGDNEASIALHRGQGFELVGVEREVGRKFGHWIDVTVMQRMLRPAAG